MATYTVTTLTDENDAETGAGAPPGAGLSLREAITLANANASADTIRFATSPADQTIAIEAYSTEASDPGLSPLPAMKNWRNASTVFVPPRAPRGKWES